MTRVTVFYSQGSSWLNRTYPQLAQENIPTGERCKKAEKITPHYISTYHSSSRKASFGSTIVASFPPNSKFGDSAEGCTCFRHDSCRGSEFYQYSCPGPCAIIGRLIIRGMLENGFRSKPTLKLIMYAGQLLGMCDPELMSICCPVLQARMDPLLLMGNDCETSHYPLQWVLKSQWKICSP